MTREQIDDLEGIPRWLGRAMYPGGAPMRKDQISFEDHTYQELYMKRCEDICKRHVPPNFDDEHLLRNYVLYYIHAPIFDGEFMDELRGHGDIEDMGLDSLVMKCLEYGIDPL
jgi:hypothetical protein